MDEKTIPILPRNIPSAKTPTPPTVSWDQDFHYRALFEQMEDCVFIVSLDLRYIAANPQALYRLGYSEQELIGKSVNEIMYQNSPLSTENILGNTSNLFERVMRCKDGSSFPVEIRTSIVYNLDGSPAYVQTIARDITERKVEEHSRKYRNLILTTINNAAERLLRSADVQKGVPEILRLIGDTTDLMRCAVIQAKDGSNFKNGFEICFEWQSATALSVNLEAIVHDLPSNQIFSSIDSFIEMEIFTNAPEISVLLPIVFIPIFEEDCAWGFLGLLSADTKPEWAPVQRETIRTAANIIGAALQRQYVEQKIHTSEARSSAILSALPYLIIRIDQAGNILDYSAREDHPLYMQREKVAGKKISELWNGEFLKQIMPVTDGNFLVASHLQKEFKLSNSDNTYEALLDPIGVTETMIVIRDISHQVHLNQMKSDFINRASHELRTPLTTALLMCNLIQGDSTAAEKAEYWQILNNELNRQKTLIDRFLTAGRLESGQLILEPETLDLIPILEEAVLAIKLIAQKKNIMIKLSELPAPLMIWGDKSGLQQVFINLINNAVKFSPEGSFVTVNISRKDDQVHIAIADQGLGIPPEAIPNLFQQFFRARNVTLAEIPGTGVGLYIVKSILEELQGSINVESEINKGTTFIVTLKASA